MTLVKGHLIWRRHSGKVVARFVKFPHRCPGEKCAIHRWLHERLHKL